MSSKKIINIVLILLSIVFFCVPIIRNYPLENKLILFAGSVSMIASVVENKKFKYLLSGVSLCILAYVLFGF